MLSDKDPQAHEPMRFWMWLTLQHISACREYSVDGGDPWNIYYRMGTIAAWQHLRGIDADYEMCSEEWEAFHGEDRDAFFAFSNEISSRPIVEV